MEKLIALLEKVPSLDAETKIFVVTVLALLVAGFSLYVALEVLKRKK